METQLRILDEKKLDRLLFNRSIYKRKTQKSEPSFEEFLKNINKWIINIMECSGVYFFMDDPLNKRLKLEKNRLILISQYSSQESLLGLTTSASANNSISRAYRDKVIINYPNGKEPRSPFDQKFKSKSFIAIPIQIQGSPIGVLFLTKDPKPHFTVKNNGLVNIISEFIATTIANFLDNNRSYLLSITDNLTGLYNDRYFHEALYTEVEECTYHHIPLHLIFFDLDNLKRVNDTHGHLAGSTVLSEIGQILKKSRKKVWAARYGGDEFVIIVRDRTTQEVIDLMEELRIAIQDYTFLGRPFFGQKPLLLKEMITASFGIACLQDIIAEKESGNRYVFEINNIKNTLLKRSDEAMYLAKSSGKNKVIYRVG